MSGRAKNRQHAEFEILSFLMDKIDLISLRRRMATDSVSEKRFDGAAKNVSKMIDNMIQKRRHYLPEDHVEYEVKE